VNPVQKQKPLANHSQKSLPPEQHILVNMFIGICEDQLPQKALETNTILLAELMIAHIKLKYTSWRKRAKL
jgi:hypothetical protein